MCFILAIGIYFPPSLAGGTKAEFIDEGKQKTMLSAALATNFYLYAGTMIICVGPWPFSWISRFIDSNSISTK